MGAAESKSRPTLDFDGFNLYQVLDISEDASGEEIKRAFRQRALETHPDKNLDDMDSASKRFLRVQEAYETLSNPITRNVYDFEMKNSPPEDAKPRQTDSTPNFMPGEFRTQAQSGRRTSPCDGGFSVSLFPWIIWLFSWLNMILPQSWVEPSDPLLYYIPRDYINRQKRIHCPKGMSAKDIHDYFLRAMEVGSWEENGQDQSLFTLIRNLFECLAYDEIRWGNEDWIPHFGSGNSAWSVGDECGASHYAEEFYDYWLNFETEKTFDWLNPYYTDMPGHPRARREIRKRYMEIQLLLQKEYNELVQTIVDAVLQCDPRYSKHIYVRFYMDGRPPSDDFYMRFLNRSRARKSRSETCHCEARDTRPSQSQDIKPQQRTQTKNERKKQKRRNKAKKKSSW